MEKLISTASRSNVAMKHGCAVIKGKQWSTFRSNEFIDHYKISGFNMKTIHAEDNTLKSYFNNRREYRCKKSVR